MEPSVRLYVYLARQKDEEACLHLLKKYDPLVRCYAANYRDYYPSWEEAYAAARVFALAGMHECSADIENEQALSYHMKRAIHRSMDREAYGVEQDKRHCDHTITDETGSLSDLPLWIKDERAQCPAEAVVRHELLQMVMDVFNRLRPHQQYIVRRRCYGDTFKQIGEVLGISESYASRLFKRAIEHIREQVKPREYG